jgi:hypothetical protein
MWLINAKTLELQYVTEAYKGLYVILSHTWAEEEVSFQDFQNLDQARKKKGFDKIQRTCRLALDRGLPFAWVDTCCIDKSSSAELSEAINSMFRWYQESDLCVVFLSDLRPSPQPELDFPHQFSVCRWLTRGFTLQELIAPSDVAFYDVAWNYRGSKLSWKSLVSEATGVDESILDEPEGLPLIPVGRRMSWASKRNTRRVEDMAYCLLGIFDVNMALIYGEGSKAFTRLQEEIAKQTCDLSLFAWQQKGPSPPYRGILAQSPAEFAKCGALKHKIRDAFLTNEYTFTNKGLRIDTALISFPDVTKDCVWNLGCSKHDDWSKMDTRGYLGVFLTKTVMGWVRVTPNLLFEAGTQRRGPNGFGTIYMRNHLSRLESLRVDRRFEGALHVRFPEDTRISVIAPEALWDKNRHLFLNQGQGINVYIRLEFHRRLGHTTPRSPPMIVACSTMGKPVCVVWGEEHPMWPHVQRFMESSKGVLSDFVAADYLRLRFLGNHGSPEADTTKVLPYTLSSPSNSSVSMQVELEDHVFEDQQGFLLNIETSLPVK